MAKQKSICDRKGGHGLGRFASVYDTIEKRRYPRSRCCECLRTCGRRFLDETSLGTILLNVEFRGCQPLEDKLVAEGFFANEPLERWTSSGFFYDEIANEIPLTLFIGVEITGADRLQNLVPDEHREKGEGATNGFSSLIGSHNLKKRVSATFEEYWRNLSSKQREAVSAYYIDNNEGLSVALVAKKLGIGSEALKERLVYAKKKLFKAYPDRKPKVRVNLRASDLILGGFFRKSSSKCRGGKAKQGATTALATSGAKKRNWLWPYQQDWLFWPTSTLDNWQGLGDKPIFDLESQIVLDDPESA